jgi:hypothetical protein
MGRDFAHPEAITLRDCATGLQAHRCVVVGVPVKWPRADANGFTARRMVRHPPTDTASTMDAGALRGGRRNGRREAGYGNLKPRTSYRPTHLRRERAGCASASR